MNLLRDCRALTALTAAARREVCAAAEERAFEAGSVIVRQGDAAEGLLIILEGDAHAVLRDQGGRDHRVGGFTRGDLVGEMALVTREPRSATVTADSPIRALLVPTAAFDRLAVRHRELGLVLTQLVADRLGRGAHDGLGGKRVEGFLILRCLGRGGMSVVYRAQDESTGELVVLKMMSSRLIYNSAALTRFREEADLVQGLDHENSRRAEGHAGVHGAAAAVGRTCRPPDRRLRARMPGVRAADRSIAVQSDQPVRARPREAMLRLPPAAEIGEGVSAELYEFLQRALHVEPTERPSSAASLVKWAAPCAPPPRDLIEDEGRGSTAVNGGFNGAR